MGLDVIGAGFGRTGTLSLKTALERLGFERCYHMIEAFSRPTDFAVWGRALDGEPVDWNALFDGYRATVDWPACAFWRQLHEQWPDAKVLLSVRPAERWWSSFHDTIYQVVSEGPGPAGGTLEFPAELAELFVVGRRVVVEGSLGGRLGSKEEIVAAYEAHNQSVRDAFAAAPPGQFLEFDVVEGWEPLCGFLGVDVPDEPFPNVNDKAMFRSMFGLEEAT